MDAEPRVLRIFEHGPDFICAYSMGDVIQVQADHIGYSSIEEYIECEGGEEPSEMNCEEGLTVCFEGWYDVPAWLKEWAVENGEEHMRTFSMKAREWAVIHPRGFMASEEN